MATVEPIRVGVEPSRTGIITRPVASALAAVDQWDVMLIIGVALLVIGVGLQWGLAMALIAGGVLLTVGSLYGARNTVQAGPD